MSRYSTAELRELRCNAFAAKFLLPAAALRSYERPRDAEDVKALLVTVARDYRVNTEPVAIKLREENWITDRTLQSFRRVRLLLVPRLGVAGGTASRLFAYPRVETLVETPNRICSSTRAVSGSRARHAATDGNTTSCPAGLRTRGRATWIRRPPKVNSVGARPQ